MIRKVVSVLSCAILLGGPALGAPHRTSRKIKHEDVDIKRIAQEVVWGKEALQSGDVAKMLCDAYVVSALYYSDGFIAKLEKRSKGKSVQDSILLGLKPLITDALRDEYSNYLIGLIGRSPDEFSIPDSLPFGGYYLEDGEGFERSHPDAIDLFVREGTTVRSMTYGVVVLAQAGWQSANPFSTVSRKGGNEVIIFNPRTKRFYRYCHLSAVMVTVLDLVKPGDEIGSVGHTGLNAAQKGHGRHLHLEINQGGAEHSMHALSKQQLRAILEAFHRE